MLVFGQSNADCRADADSVTIRAGYTASYPLPLYEVYALTTANPLVWVNNGVRSLSPRSDAESTTENMGVHLSMGRFLDSISSGEWAIAQVAIGGAGLNDHLKATAIYPTGTNAFTQMVAYAKSAEVALNGDITAFVFIQGETDAADATDAAAYETNLTQYIADMRAASGSKWSNVPFIYNRLSTHNSAPQKNAIRTAQTNVDAAVSGTTMVNCDDLTLPDNVHFSADSYVLLGERFALAILDALGYTVPPPVDATSGIKMPKHILHWRHLISNSSLSIDPPWDSLDLQETSGNAAGAMGNLVLTANAAPLYQQTIAGWSTRGIGFTDGTASQRIGSGQVLLPDPATESIGILSNIAVTNNPAAARGILGLGVTADVSARIQPGPVTRISAGSNVTSANLIGSNARPYVMVINRATSTDRLWTDQEQLSPTFASTLQKNVVLGAASSLPPPTAVANCFHIWRGAGAEKLTAANTKAMLQALGWTVTGY